MPRFGGLSYATQILLSPALAGGELGHPEGQGQNSKVLGVALSHANSVVPTLASRGPNSPPDNAGDNRICVAQGKSQNFGILLLAFRRPKLAP